MTAYLPAHPAQSHVISTRGVRHRLWVWGASPTEPTTWPLPADDNAPPPLFLLHGWMDVAASFQFMVDALYQAQGDTARQVIALDWRGFGDTESPPCDTYWHPDYLADLDALFDLIAPGRPIDLLGHSMGGNIAMVYAGVRPARIRKLINLEGFGLPASNPRQAPSRYARWLDELKTPAALRTYASLEDVAARLQKNNPLLPPERAAWLAPHWARLEADGQWHLRADPVHKRIYPVLYQADEAVACWAKIKAPMLWVEGDQTDFFGIGGQGNPWWGEAYPRAEFDTRLSVMSQVERRMLAQAGHMLHHDQPAALAAAVLGFVSA
jgi:pimeloyl-ACP methyl ester carboxylesterase